MEDFKSYEEQYHLTERVDINKLFNKYISLVEQAFGKEEAERRKNEILFGRNIYFTTNAHSNTISMKDERFLKTDMQTYELLQLTNFPNFHASGSKEGMRKQYYGEDAYLVQAGDYIYHVDEDTFQAVKDNDLIRQQPEWLQDINKTLAERQSQPLSSIYEGDSQKQTVMDLAFKGDLMQRMLEQIDKSVTEARLAVPNGMGEMYVSCKFNGEHKLIPLTQEDKSSLIDLFLNEWDARLKMIAARELAEPLFESITKEVENNQQQAAFSTANAMDDDHILETADKISAVLQRFYSLHEADELTRIITDPDKTVEDVQAAMSVIYQQNRLEEEPAQQTTKKDGLTEEDARSMQDFDLTLEKVLPKGCLLCIPDLTTNDLYSYVMYNNFRNDVITSAPLGEEPSFTNTLEAFANIDKHYLQRLMPASEVYDSQEYKDFIETLRYPEDYDATVTEMLHKHPDLTGAQFDISQMVLRNTLLIEGKSLDTVVSIMLQKMDIDDAQLKAVLTDKAAQKAFVDEINQNPDKELKIIKNSEYIYFYEPGTLGHAKVDHMRGVVFSGETMSIEAQRRIMDFAQNRNEVTNGRNAFFWGEGLESQQRLYLDTMANKCHKISSQLDYQGNTIYTEGSRIVHENDVRSWQDITGRITNAAIIGYDKPKVRCKIDGQWQMAQPLTKAEISRMVHFMDKPEEMKTYALSVATTHFATSLYESQEQNKGMKR